MLNTNPSQQDKLNLWEALVQYINETGHMPSIAAVGTEEGVYAVRPEAVIKDMLAEIHRLASVLQDALADPSESEIESFIQEGIQEELHREAHEAAWENYMPPETDYNTSEEIDDDNSE